MPKKRFTKDEAAIIAYVCKITVEQAQFVNAEHALKKLRHLQQYGKSPGHWMLTMRGEEALLSAIAKLSR